VGQVDSDFHADAITEDRFGNTRISPDKGQSFVGWRFVERCIAKADRDWFIRFSWQATKQPNATTFLGMRIDRCRHSDRGIVFDEEC
jgi:hypothetical protein